MGAFDREPVHYRPSDQLFGIRESRTACGKPLETWRHTMWFSKVNCLACLESDAFKADMLAERLGGKPAWSQPISADDFPRPARYPPRKT